MCGVKKARRDNCSASATRHGHVTAFLCAEASAQSQPPMMTSPVVAKQRWANSIHVFHFLFWNQYLALLLVLRSAAPGALMMKSSVVARQRWANSIPVSISFFGTSTLLFRWCREVRPLAHR